MEEAAWKCIGGPEDDLPSAIDRDEFAEAERWLVNEGYLDEITSTALDRFCDRVGISRVVARVAIIAVAVPTTFAVAVPTTMFLAGYIFHAIMDVLAVAWPFLAFIFLLYLCYLGHQQEVAKKKEEQKKEEEARNMEVQRVGEDGNEAFIRILEEIGRG